MMFKEIIHQYRPPLYAPPPPISYANDLRLLLVDVYALLHSLGGVSGSITLFSPRFLLTPLRYPFPFPPLPPPLPLVPTPLYVLLPPRPRLL